MLEAICLGHEHQRQIEKSPVNITRPARRLILNLGQFHARHMDVSLLRAERQGEAGYEAAKGDVSRPDRHLFNRHSDGTGNEERPLRGTNPNRPDGGRCLHSLRT